MVLSEANSAGPASGYDLFDETPYRTIERLRAGGMGEVYLVEHRTTRRRVVAKLIHAKLGADPRLMERLRIEAQALGQLNHQNIVRVIGFERTRTQRPFLVMEYLEGRTLADEIAARGPLPVHEAVSYACQALSALAAAHEKGLVHRDIKPDNLFVCPLPDGRSCLKLLDFGVVRVLPGSDAVRPLPPDYRTRTGAVVGTPRFVSPEGAEGRPVDARADLYALGLVLYAMLVGRGPFDHLEGDHVLIAAHVAEEPEPPSRFAREPLPPELDRAVLKALSKDPDQRFQSAEEFQGFLEHVSELLRRPQGWLETTVFRPGEEPNVPAHLVARGRLGPNAANAPATPTTHIRSAEPAPPENAASPEAAAPTLVLSPVAAVIVCIVAALVVGLATVGLAGLVWGTG
jgi:serine/threonine-protein kinase